MCRSNLTEVWFVQIHTIYQRGLSEDDPHVKYFWAALGQLSEVSRYTCILCSV